MSVYWITDEVRSGLVSLHVTMPLPSNTRTNILVTIITPWWGYTEGNRDPAVISTVLSISCLENWVFHIRFKMTSYIPGVLKRAD